MEATYQPPTYHCYTPLEPGYIRLVRIHPLSTSEYEPIVVDIETFELASSPAYVALSYTWGPPTFEAKEAALQEQFTREQRCYPIHSNKGLLLATRNLRDAMRQLRNLEPDAARERFGSLYGRAKPLYTWIDGLCINQNDLEERAQQVAIMGDIYSGAGFVLSWIGEWDDCAANGFELADALDQLARLKLDHTRIRANPTPHDADLWHLVGCKPFPQAKWWDYFLLLGREWFRRTWVIQEVGLGPNPLLVLCGSKVFGVATIVNSISFAYFSNWWTHNLAPDGWRHLNDCIKLFNSHPLRHMTNIWHYRMHAISIPFFNLQRFVFGSTICSDTRDKIFGTTALASEFRSTTKGRFTVDYSMSVEEVFVSATKWSLLQSASLEVFGLVENREAQRTSSLRSPMNLPSWCPNYNVETNARQPAPMETLPFMEHLRRIYHASRQSQHVGFDYGEISSPQVQVRGVKCDLVLETSKSLRHNLFGYTWLRHGGVLDVILNVDSTRSAPLTDMFWRTLVHDMPTDDPKDADDHQSFYTVDHLRCLFLLELGLALPEPPSIETLTRIQPKLARLSQIDPHARRLFPDEKHYSHLYGNIAAHNVKSTLDEILETPAFNLSRLTRLPFSVGARTRGRRMFRTAEHRLGLSHVSVSANDEVWLLAGGPTPYILRPLSNGCFMFVGEAYVHGVMQGEVWPENEGDLTTITLE